MRNAREELEELLKETGCHILAAEIRIGRDIADPYYEDPTSEYILKEKRVVSDYRKFMESLDFQYDAGYGLQVLFGTIWFTDGTWADRGEYDGSEWWAHRKKPELPGYLRG